eukprot:6201112-Pleurochrysis_carterae.AAC.2
MRKRERKRTEAALTEKTSRSDVKTLKSTEESQQGKHGRRSTIAPTSFEPSTGEASSCLPEEALNLNMIKHTNLYIVRPNVTSTRKSLA